MWAGWSLGMGGGTAINGDLDGDHEENAREPRVCVLETDAVDRCRYLYIVMHSGNDFHPASPLETARRQAARCILHNAAT